MSFSDADLPHLATPDGLHGRGIVVTRAEDEDGPLCRLLRREGAHPILRPTLGFEYEDGDSALAEVAGRMEDFDWLVISSSRAAAALGDLGVLRRARPARLRVAAVGPGTANAIGSWGWSASIVPVSGGATALIEVLDGRVEPGDRILFPCSEAAADTLPDALEKMGAEVEKIVAYRPVSVEQDPARWRTDLDAGDLDALTFTSPSALAAFERFPAELLDRLLALPAAVQGPTTGAAVREAGWTTVLEADPTTFEGLVTCLSDHFES